MAVKLGSDKKPSEHIELPKRLMGERCFKLLVLLHRLFPSTHPCHKHSSKSSMFSRTHSSFLWPSAHGIRPFSCSDFQTPELRGTLPF
jgi:hypothetical protein